MRSRWLRRSRPTSSRPTRAGVEQRAAELLETECWNEEIGALTQVAGEPQLDAALLLAVHLGYFAPDDPRATSHVDAIRKALSVDGGLLRRYTAPDDFGDTHAAFTVCTFWLVEALAILGRTDEATELFDRLLGLHNGLGLYSRGHPARHARAERQLPADVQPRRAHQRRVPSLPPLGLAPALEAISNWSRQGGVTPAPDQRRSHRSTPSRVPPSMTAPTRHVWAALLVVYVVWGSTYFGIKIAVETLPPLLAGGSRFLVAAGLLAAILAVRGTSLRVTRRELAGAGVVGFFLLTLGVGLVHVAETRIDSSVAAMIAGTVPLQIIVMRSITRESPARATKLSALTGLFGLVLVVAPGLGAGLERARTRGDDQRDGLLVDGVVRVQATDAAPRSLRRRGVRDGRRRGVPLVGALAVGEWSELERRRSRSTRSSPGSTSWSWARSSASRPTRGSCASPRSRSSSRTST